MFGLGTKIRYGSSRGQFGVLTRPKGAPPTAVIVLVHGGFWTWPYNRWLMLGLARSVRRHGWASFNVEYRRLGRLGGGGGFPATFDDVGAAVELAVEAAGARGDADDRSVPVILVGHSAGGQLALWAAREVTGVAGVISMAGPTDLRSIVEGGSGPVSKLVAGAPDDRRWEMTSPMQRIPTGVPTACVHGTQDVTVSPRNSIDYVDAAVAAGDDATTMLVDGDVHRDGIRSSSETWSSALDILTSWCAVDRRS